MYQSKEKETINRIHTESLDLGKYGKKFATGLNRDISTAFEGGNKFVYELLQNAVDAVNPESTQGLNVSFELITLGAQQYLLFSHNGTHFSENDVVRITDYATQDDDFKESKSGVENKIGYKGIGFKAVFTIANCVTIFSRGFQFRFDSNYPAWQTATYPWQVIPIWTDINFIPEALRVTMKNDNVNFLIQIKSGIQISEVLNFIIQQPTMLVFLKNLSSLRIKKSVSETVLFELTRTVLGESEMLNIVSNAGRVLGSQWLIRRYSDLEISESLRTILKSMDRHACPDRLRKATHTSVTFAAELTDQKLKPHGNSTLYCYLPTQIRAGLPCLVNTDLLLNTERAHVVDNAWNHSVFHFIANVQFKWIAELASQPHYRLSALNMLSQSSLYGVPQSCLTSFQKGYQNGVSTTAFIPAKRTQTLLMVSEALWDTTGFYDEFPELDPIPSQYQLLEDKIENRASLKKLMVKSVSFHELAGNLNQYLSHAKNKSIPFQMKILHFLYRKRDELLVSGILKNTAFLYSEESKPCTPCQLYYPIQQDIPIIAGCPKPQFIHPHVLAEIQKSPLMLPWLVSLGLKPASHQDLTLDYILRLVQESKVDHRNVLAITRYLVKYLLDKITAEQWKILSLLPVLTKADVLGKSHELYLADCFSPNPKLESKLPLSTIVSAIYVELSTESPEYQYENQRWARFFKAIGVNYDLRIHFSTVTVEHARRILPSFSLYEVSLQRELGRPIQPSDSINNMPVFSMIKYVMTLPTINRLFFMQFIRQWEEIQSAQPIQYQSFRSYFALTQSYIAFFLRNSDCLQGNDKKYYPSSKLYSSRFKAISKINQKILIPRKDYSLTYQQEIYLGLITSLSFQDCIDALLTLQKSIEIYPIVYRELLNMIAELNDTQKNILKNSDIQIPNQTNELVSRNMLRCFAIDGQDTPINSVLWFKQFPGFNQKEMISLATLFGISIVEDLSENLTFSDRVKDNDTKAFLFTKIPESSWCRIEVICYFEAQYQVKSYNIIREKIYGLLNTLSFYKVSKLQSSDIPLKAFITDHDLLYKSDWRKHKANDFFQCLGQYLELSTDSVRRLVDLLQHAKPSKLIRKWRLPESPDHLPVTRDHDTTDDEESSWEDSLVDMSHSMLDESMTDHSIISPQTPKRPEFSLFSASESKRSGRSKSNNLVSSPNRSFILDDPADDDFPDFEILRGDLVVQSRKVSKKPFKLAAVLSTESQSVHENSESFSQEGAVEAQSTSNADNHKSHQIPNSQEDQQSNSGQQKSMKNPTIDKDMIGRWGEKLIYFRYRRKYTNTDRYDCQITDIPDGFKAVGRKKSSGQPVNVSVIWHNKEWNKNENRDITLLKGEIEKVVEVKATTKNKCTFHWSRNELDLAREKTTHYTLFHVSNVGRGKPVVRKIVDPATQLAENKLQIISQKCQFEMHDVLVELKK